MPHPPFDLSPLPGEWWPVERDQGLRLERELRREVPRGHLLRGVRAEAVVVRRHLKDVIFWLPGVDQWAHVHLTGRRERDPRWPTTVVAAEWSDIVAQLVPEDWLRNRGMSARKRSHSAMITAWTSCALRHGGK